MTPERFEILAEAYGGDVARWPPDERDAAALLMAERGEWARSVLAAASDLDAALTAYAPPRGSADLADRIAARAPKPKRRSAWLGWLAPAGLGAGLAAAAAAGVLLGVSLSPKPHAPTETAQVAAFADEDAVPLSDLDV